MQAGAALGCAASVSCVCYLPMCPKRNRLSRAKRMSLGVQPRPRSRCELQARSWGASYPHPTCLLPNFVPGPSQVIKQRVTFSSWECKIENITESGGEPVSLAHAIPKLCIPRFLRCKNEGPIHFGRFSLGSCFLSPGPRCLSLLSRSRFCCFSGSLC